MEESLFIEGLQGSGKSTFVNKLSQKYPDYKVYREGEYTPVELAWCAYVNEDTYQQILLKYPTLQKEIKNNTTIEEEYYIITYTKILTDVPGFHRDLEQYEIYNGNLKKEAFEEVVLSRYKKWSGKKEIFECAILQNSIENMMLYLQMTDAEIMDFYDEVYKVFKDKNIKIIYIDTEDIRANIEVIKKERSDESGNELWFPLMIRYIEESPYGKEHGLLGMSGLISHLERRKMLERKILAEIFFEQTQILKSKKYDI